jgi:ribonuclease HI
VGIAVFDKGKIRNKLKYKLHSNCSNNQAKQLAIVKSLEALKNTNISDSRRNPRTAIIYTNSRVSLDSLSNHKKHSFLVEKVRKEVTTLEKGMDNKSFMGQAHSGNYGNETAHRLAKEAAGSHGTQYQYNRTPIRAIKHETAEETIKK